MELEDINDSVLPRNNVNLESGKEENDTLFGQAVRKRYELDTGLRRDLAVIFTITINAWLFVVFIVLLCNTDKLKLSDTVLVTLLSTTTIQVLGMMAIILYDLFPGGGNLKNTTKP
jgi:hypothetical protein